MRRWITVTLLGMCACAAEAGAGVIHRCRTPTGAIHYQQAPCTGAKTPAGERRYVPEPDSVPGATSRAQAGASRPSAARARAARNPRRAPTREQVEGASCDDVRTQRDAWEQRVGLRRTYDDLRRWNDAVARACR